jgi:hypothetical protein
MKWFPDDHLVRKIRSLLDLSWVYAELAPYSEIGRPSIDPVLMIRMLIIGYTFAIRSERQIPPPSSRPPSPRMAPEPARAAAGARQRTSRPLPLRSLFAAKPSPHHRVHAIGSSHRRSEDLMKMKSMAAGAGKLAALLALFGLALILDNCADQTKGDETQRPPVTYGFGGPAW